MSMYELLWSNHSPKLPKTVLVVVVVGLLVIKAIVTIGGAS